MEKTLNLKAVGFSLLELMVVIAIIGIMATQIPRLTRSRYTKQQSCIASLNALARHAYAHALISGKTTQLFFDFSSVPQKVSIRQEVLPKPESQEKAVFEPVTSDYGKDFFEWDPVLVIEKFVIAGNDEALGGNLKTVWIYIMPDGMAQPATLVLRDTDTDTLSTLELNPFSVYFRKT